jgi:hypothetical protein
MRVLSFVGTSVKSILFVSALVLTSLPANAVAPTVQLGEVTMQVPRKDLKAFRETVKSELGRLDFSAVGNKEHYVLSAALVQMSTRSTDGQSESTAVVSATLRREKGGDLRAMIRGRAQATDDSAKSSAAERSAMQAAVRSALRRLPEALR